MIKLSVFKCSPYLFRGNRIFIYIHADCIENGISHCWRNSVHGDFCHSLHAKWMAGLKGLNKDRFQFRHLIRTEDMITVKVALDGISFFVVAHLFTDRIPEGLSHAPFDLTAGSQWIHDDARINCHYKPVYRYRAGFYILLALALWMLVKLATRQ